MLFFRRNFFKNHSDLFKSNRALKCCAILFAMELCMAIALPFKGIAQVQNVTVQTSNASLSSVLNDVSAKYKIRFAFDNDRFSAIKVSINVKDIPFDSFMNLLAKNYGVGNKKVGNSYALFYDEKLVQVPSSTSKPKSKTQPKISVASVRGFLFDKQSNQRLRNATICFSSDSLMKTNRMGFFQRKMLTNKQLKVSSTHLACLNSDTTVAFVADMNLDLAVKPMSLINADPNLDQKSFKMFDYEESTGFTEINARSNFYEPSLVGNDLSSSLKWLLGFSLFDQIDESLALSETQYTVDGALLLATPSLFGNVGLVNGKMVHQAFASRGDADASFGGHIGGLVEVVGKNGGSPELDLTLTPIFANVYAGVPLGNKVAASVAIRRSYMDDWNRYWTNNLQAEKLIGDNANATSYDTDLFFQDIHAKLSYTPKSNHQIFVSYSGSSADQMFKFKPTTELESLDSIEERNHAFAVEWDAQLSDKWSSSLVARSTFLKDDREQFAEILGTSSSVQKTEQEQLHTDLKVYGLDWKNEYEAEHWQHRFGAGFDYSDLDQNFGLNIYASSLSGSTDFSNQLSEAYIYTQHGVSLLNDQLLLKAGLRGQYDITNQSVGLLPRYSVEYLFNKNISAYFRGGRYEQHLRKINRVDLSGNRSSLWLLAGNDWGETEFSWNNVVGLRYENNSLILNGELYYKYISNRSICWGQSLFENGVNAYSYSLYSGERVDFGLDLSAQYLQKMFSHQIKYSFGSKLEQYEGVNGGDSFAAADDRKHKLQLTERFFLKGWTATANWTFATGLPFFNSVGTIAMLDLGRMSNFSQVDLMVTKQFKTPKIVYECGLSALNVFNRDNQKMYKYHNYTLSSSDYLMVKSVRTALSFTPMIYLNARF